MGNIGVIFNLLTKVIQFVGAGVAIFGGFELFQSFSDNNPQTKSTGIKSLAGGLILIASASPLVQWFQSFLPS